MSGRRPVFHGYAYDGTAALTALAALPVVRHVLRIGADQYGGAWALVIVAALLYRRTGWWIAWAAVLATVLGAITDLRVLHDSVTYLTGAAW